MTHMLPLWLQTATAIATPLIAFAVLLVAVRQWRTAQNKLVLDLFDKRYKIYSSLNEIINKMVQNSVDRSSNWGAFASLIREARFLFGSDFTKYLERVEDNLHDLSRAEYQIAREDISSEQKAEYKRSIDDGYKFFLAHLENFPRRAEPYLRLNQRLHRTIDQVWEDARRPQAPYEYSFKRLTQSQLQAPMGNRQFVAGNLKKVRDLLDRFPTNRANKDAD